MGQEEEQVTHLRNAKGGQTGRSTILFFLIIFFHLRERGAAGHTVERVRPQDLGGQHRLTGGKEDSGTADTELDGSQVPTPLRMATHQHFTLHTPPTATRLE